MPALEFSGIEFGVNTQTVANQTQPSIARFADGSFVITWVTLDPAQDGSGNAIKGQLFDATGNKLGAEFLVNNQGEGSQFNQSVAVLGDGSFVVTWITNDSTQDGSGNAVKARLFASSGTPLGDEFLVNTQFASSQSTANVASLANGGFVVTWDDWSTFDQKARIYGADGVALGNEFRTNTNTSGFQEFGDVIGLSGGGFVATWRTTDTSADGSGQAVKAQIFDSVGNPVGAEFRINTLIASDQYDPALSALPNGGFVAVWRTLDTTQDGSGSAIKGQIFSATGVKLGAEFLVNQQTANTQQSPTVTALADGGFIVAWDTLDAAQDGSSMAVKARVFGADGLPVGNEVRINTITPGAQFLSDMVALPDGKVVVTWVSETGDGNGYAIRGQILAPVNLAPVITSDGGGAAATVFVAENQLDVTVVTASDSDGPQQPTYAISGGADAAHFTIDAATGALRFIAAPNFETPTDAGSDGAYDVVVSASDGRSTDSQALTIVVGNVNEGVTITSGTAFAVAESGLAVGSISASDADGDTVTYAIAGGSDAARFTIDAATGALAFVAAPNFEAPADSDGNNVYEVVVAASDGSLSAESAVQVTVGNVNEAPVILSSGAYSVNENSTSGVFVAASDIDGDAVSYAIAGGADAARFSIDAASGRLSFIAAPNFEAPADADGDNVYAITVVASDGTLSVQKALSIAVVNTIDGMTVNGTSKANTLSGGAAEDTVNGLAGNDILYGLGGADTLNGGDGNDKLYGGAGADLLVGGSGADQFHFTSTSDSTAGVMDFIADFLRSQNDKVSLSAIDANSALAGDQAFSFIGLAAFSGVAGQLRYYQSGGDTFVAGDVNGDGLGDFLIGMDTALALTATDFIL